MAHGFRDIVKILRPPQFKKSPSYHTLHYYRKKRFEQISVFESKKEDMIESGSFLPLVTLLSCKWRLYFFDVIGRLCPKKRQKTKFCSVNG